MRGVSCDRCHSHQNLRVQSHQNLRVQSHRNRRVHVQSHRNLRVQRRNSYRGYRRPKRGRRPRQAWCLHGGRDHLEGDPWLGVDYAACLPCCAEQAKSKCSPEIPDTRGMQLLLLECVWGAAVRTVYESPCCISSRSHGERPAGTACRGRSSEVVGCEAARYAGECPARANHRSVRFARL